MMGRRLFYEFDLDERVSADHLLRKIDSVLDLDGLHRQLGPFYSDTGRPSVDPELMIRMLLVGYCYGIRSERRLCEEVSLNLAYGDDRDGLQRQHDRVSRKQVRLRFLFVQADMLPERVIPKDPAGYP